MRETKDILDEISRRWFLTEPALFSVYCRHRVSMNGNMRCPVRVGRGVLEYNPVLMKDLGNEEVEKIFRFEMIRVLLLHPYARKPAGCSDVACAMGSDMTLATFYPSSGMLSPSYLGLPEGQYYEWYARQFQQSFQKAGTEDNPSEGPGGDGAKGMIDENEKKDSAGLWEEDPWMQEGIRQALADISDWGSLPASLSTQIKANLIPKLDYRKVLSGFRSSILCAKRDLSRMRPNRRSGFQYMGSIRQLRTNYLVAVDMSGSISDGELARFFSVVNRFFKYGVEQIDVLPFDTQPGDLMPLSKARKQFKVTGRGGTDFQPAIDYAAHHPEYDALIFFTDGEAPVPAVPARWKGRILWILRSEPEYKKHRTWMRNFGRVCYIH